MKKQKTLRTVDGADVHPGDLIRISTYFMELDETFTQEGVLTYDKGEDQFYIEGTDTIVNVWDHIKILRTKNVRKIVAQS